MADTNLKDDNPLIGMDYVHNSENTKLCILTLNLKG